MNMRILHTLSIELGWGCNLSAVHRLCPNNLGRERYAAMGEPETLTDAEIVSLVHRAYEHHGFRGYVNWSFYNEPLMKMDRLFRVVSQVQARTPDLPHMLITNGTLLPGDLGPFAAFQHLSITDYGPPYEPDPVKVATLLEMLGPRRAFSGVERGLSVNSGKLDQRMRGLGEDRSHLPCWFPFRDFVVDAGGNVHLCCFDWRGFASPGNVIRDGLDSCLSRWWTMVEAISAAPMAVDAPASCRHCSFHLRPRLDRIYGPARAESARWLETRT